MGHTCSHAPPPCAGAMSPTLACPTASSFLRSLDRVDQVGLVDVRRGGKASDVDFKEVAMCDENVLGVKVGKLSDLVQEVSPRWSLR